MAEAAELECGVVGDARQHVAQVRLWIQAVQLCRFDEAVKGCRPVGAPLRAGEEVVLAPDRDATQGPLGGVVVEREAAVIEGTGQRRPSREHVAERACEFGAAGELRHDGFGPGPQGVGRTMSGRRGLRSRAEPLPSCPCSWHL